MAWSKCTFQRSCNGILAVLTLLVVSRGAADEASAWAHGTSTSALYRDNVLEPQHDASIPGRIAALRDATARTLLVRLAT